MDSLFQGILAMLSGKSTAYRFSVGFSLIELVVALAVLATLVAVATPYLAGVMANNRVETEANRLVSALNLARTSALKFKQPITFCRSNTGAACDATAWTSAGWLLYQDLDEDSTVDAGETIIRWFQGNSQNVTMVSSEALQVVFDSRGYLDTSNEKTFTFSAPKCSSNGGRKITIIASGSPRINKVACP